MLELIDRLALDKVLQKKVIDLAHKDRVNVLALADRVKQGDWNCLEAADDLTRLAVVIECLPKTLAQYQSLGIPEEIFDATMEDICIWCENNQNKGLHRIHWIKNHLTCQLFKIGRLQYQLYRCENETLRYDLLPFEKGENLLYVHIPQGEKLIYSDCVLSLQEALQFFDRYFPAFSYDFFFCESWLLYEENWQFMKPPSNILEFSTLFDVMYSVDDDTQAIERIFGKRHKLKRLYPESTTLQKNAKSYLLGGGKLGLGIGIIEKECFS